jgi:hypothetical protein
MTRAAWALLLLLPAAQDRQAFERDLRDLEKLSTDPDVAVYAKAAAWALAYEPALKAGDAELLRKTLDRGARRAADADRAWCRKKGRVARGFRSEVDGSIQPYGLIVPASYDPSKPMRLDVVLHGSQQPSGTSELRFLNQFEDGDRGPDQDYLELHPLGRVENGYRYSGETDVFEAIEAACRNYAIDRRRIVLRGMSMGASGTWHLGLKHPDRFVALGPYCGYVDTHQFSETPVKGFVKVGPLPPYQEKTLTMLDSVGYAANAGMAPAIACVGDKDVFFSCHVLMGEAMQREGLSLVNLISPGTGHVIDPVTHREQMRRIAERASTGLDPAPKRVRFVTWTLKYNRCFWIELLGLREHYVRAEVDARIGDDGDLVIEEPKNVLRFSILPPASGARRARIGGSRIDLPGDGAKPVTLEERGGTWVLVEKTAAEGKRPGLQGPIDDAFASAFLCVRGTGTPWNAKVQKWADASLERFAAEWRFWFRGDLPVKDDARVTEEDRRTRHLILFGDPGSNRWIADALPKLPLSWTREELRVRGRNYGAAEHAPALIAASPLPGAAGRYVVLNSGHTFHPPAEKINYLFYPRLGDWAVLKLGDGAEGSVADAGLFDEQWK